MSKKVYVGMSADLLHHGHLNVIKEARKYGEVIVGLHTDEVVASYWRPPLLSYSERKTVVENIIGVKEVVPQAELDYVPNLLEIKPDYVVHGDDWREGIQKSIRARVIETLKQWGGELIEVKYTEGVSITKLDDAIRKLGTTPQSRMKKLRALLKIKPLIRIMEAHNGLTGLIVENTKVIKDETIKEYDGIWISSLCDSTAKGKPDIELVDFSSRLGTINDIMEVTTKPIILDGDTGGQTEHFVFAVKSLERLGVSAMIIEDKIGLKRNSLFGTDVAQQQDTIEGFSHKISKGKKAQVTDEFMIIARIESLIVKAGMEDALRRAEAYIKAGADGIMIHSKENDPHEILEFCSKYSGFKYKVPLVAVPSSYCQIKEKDLARAGVNIVIYANHLIRSAFPAMVKTAENILINERAMEAEQNCMSIKEVINLIPMCGDND